MARAQHLAHLGPRQNQAIAVVARTGLVGRHRRAASAEESVLEHQRHDSEFARSEPLEDFLRVVTAVVIADAGVIAPDDKVGATIVAPDDGVKEALALDPSIGKPPLAWLTVSSLREPRHESTGHMPCNLHDAKQRVEGR